MNSHEDIKLILGRLALLEKRLAELEQKGNFFRYFDLQKDSSDNSECHVCHGKFKDMTHYVCNHHQCPSRITFGDTNPPTFQ